jgi:hypothetical protein
MNGVCATLDQFEKFDQWPQLKRAHAQKIEYRRLQCGAVARRRAGLAALAADSLAR